MRLMQKLAMLIVLGGISFCGVVCAQAQNATSATETITVDGVATVVPAGLSAAIQAGDTATIQAMLAGANATTTVNIASVLVAAAGASKGTNPTQAAVLAAIAVNTGALGDFGTALALAIVGSNPTALALITNPNAPKTGSGSSFLSLVNVALNNPATVIYANQTAASGN